MGDSQLARRGVVLLASVALLASFLAFYVRSVDSPWRDVLYNSDLLYLPAVLDDLLAGRSLQDWIFTPAPYFFPDMVLMAPLRLASGNLHATILLFGVVQLLLFGVGLGLLARRLCPPHAYEVCLLLLLAVALFLICLPTLPHVFTLPLVNAFHFGALLVLPYVLLLVIDLLTLQSWRWGVQDCWRY